MHAANYMFECLHITAAHVTGLIVLEAQIERDHHSPGVAGVYLDIVVKVVFAKLYVAVHIDSRRQPCPGEAGHYVAAQYLLFP